jgi:transcriptional regulator GlxA family with amidase domain
MSTQLHTYDTLAPRAWSELANLAEPGVAKVPRGLSRRALNRACSYIAENLGERFTLDDLARQAGVSRFHFARLFRVSMGESPMAYLLKSRIERAKQMLLQDDRPVCEIAAALGFCDQSHLTRTFRRLTGLTPREFARLQALTGHQPMRQEIATEAARQSRGSTKNSQ